MKIYESTLESAYELHSTGAFQQLRGRLFWIQIDSEAPTLLMHTPKCTAMLKEALAGPKRHLYHIPRSV